MIKPYSRGKQSWRERQRILDFYIRRAKSMASNPTATVFDISLKPKVFEIIGSNETFAQNNRINFDSEQQLIKANFFPVNPGSNSHTLPRLINVDFDFSMSLYLDSLSAALELFEPDEENGSAENPTHYLTLVNKGLEEYKALEAKKAHLYFLDASKIKADDPELLFRLGLLRLNSPELIDEYMAYKYFTHASSILKIRQKNKRAAICQLHAAFAAYCIHHDAESLEASQKAIDLYPKLNEAYYINAKVLALHTLKNAIEKAEMLCLDNPVYCVKIAADPDFEPISKRLFKRVRRIYKRSVDQKYKMFSESVRKLEGTENLILESKYFVQEIQNIYKSRISLKNIHQQTDRIQKVYDRDSIYDFILFNQIISSFFKKTDLKVVKSAVSLLFRRLLIYFVKFSEQKAQEKHILQNILFIKNFQMVLSILFGVVLFFMFDNIIIKLASIVLLPALLLAIIHLVKGILQARKVWGLADEKVSPFSAMREHIVHLGSIVVKGLRQHLVTLIIFTTLLIAMLTGNHLWGNFSSTGITGLYVLAVCLLMLKSLNVLIKNDLKKLEGNKKATLAQIKTIIVEEKSKGIL